MLVEGTIAFCLPCLENPFRIYAYPSIFKDKKPILYLSKFIEINLAQRIL